MTTLTATEARTKLPDALNRVTYARERVVIEKHGRSVAALVSVDDLQLLQELERLLDITDGKKALAQLKSGKKRSIGLKAMRRKLGL